MTATLAVLGLMAVVRAVVWFAMGISVGLGSLYFYIAHTHGKDAADLWLAMLFGRLK